MRSKVGLPNQTEGVIFTPIPCYVVYFEPERVGVNLLLDSLKAGDPTTRVLSSFEQVERYVKDTGHFEIFLLKTFCRKLPVPC